jgi:hypothetical protein
VQTPAATLALIGSSAVNPAVPALVATLAPRPGQDTLYAGPLAIVDQPTTNPFNRAARPNPQNNSPRFLRLQLLTGTPAPGLPPLTLTGKKLSLQISGGDPAHHAEVRQALTAKLTALGATLDDASPLKLSVTTSDGKSVERTYTLTGKRAGEKITRSFTERITTLTLEDTGQPIWQQTWRNSIPMLISTRGEQTFEQALDEADQHDIRPAASAPIPPTFVRPPTPDLPQLNWN